MKEKDGFDSHCRRSGDPTVGGRWKPQTPNKSAGRCRVMTLLRGMAGGWCFDARIYSYSSGEAQLRS